mmetsp:Transcript_11163/g.21951  ORF Transcript_11163/g.21951 Transcript_11163/m.21951 type:complete len:718 (+) Transcript_11163:362-2515(+)
MRRCRCRTTTLPSSKRTEILPVSGVFINVSIAQDVATIRLQQVFYNPKDIPLEIDYSFPTPPNAAVVMLRVINGDKVIDGVVKEKERAREEFNDAIARGDIPYMAEVDDDSVNLHIGTLEVESKAIVEVVYVVECKFESGKWRFVMPRNLVAKHLEKKVKAPKGSLLDWQLECIIETSSPVTHADMSLPFSAESLSSNSLKLSANDKSFPYKDISISYTILNTSGPFLALQRDPRTGALGLHFSFQPSCAEVSVEDFDPLGEFILMLDRSGSMEGTAMEKAKEAAELFIRSLPEKSRFNIVSFGSTHSLMFEESVAFNRDNISEAVANLQGYSADLGSTDILTPLQRILSTKPSSSYPRFVFLITDGAVTNGDKVIDLVWKNHLSTRVSCIGIGKDCDRKFLKDVALAGQGTTEIVYLSKGIAQGVIQALHSSIKPALTDIEVSWLSCSPILISPIEPFYAFSGDRVSFNAVLDEGVSDYEFRVAYFDTLSQEAKINTYSIPASAVTEGSQAVVQAVKGNFGKEDEALLSVKYQVLAKSTSIIAVNQTVRTVVEPSHLIAASVVSVPRTKSRRRTIIVSKVSLSKKISADIDRSRSLAGRSRSRSRSPVKHISTYRSTSFIQLQLPSGNWELSPQLEALLLSQANLSFGAALSKWSDLPSSVVVTAVVVAVLEEQYQGEAQVWSLVVQKARRWLKKQGATDLLNDKASLLEASKLAT